MNQGRLPIIPGTPFWQLAMALWLGWLLAGSVWGQSAPPIPPELARLVRPTPGTRPLGEVLTELSRQGQLPFSYSSSLVPVNRRCYLRPGPARPIASVLREVLASAHFSYGLLDGQLVLWPDQVAIPPGVTAVNGRATPLVPTTRAPTPPLTVTGSGKASGFRLPITRNSQVANQLKPVISGLRPSPTIVKRARATGASSKTLAISSTATPMTSRRRRTLRRNLVTNSLVDATTSSYALRSHSPLARYPGHKTQYGSSPTHASYLSAEPLGKKPLVVSLGKGRSRTYSTAYGRQAALEVAASGHSYRTDPTHRSPHQLSRPREPLAPLVPLVAVPTSVFSTALPVLPILADSGLAPGRGTPAGKTVLPDTSAKKANVLANLLRRGYLHGEAWGSESLPLNAAVKAGIPRIYLVLGVAAGPFDHQSGGALGVGLGTVGQPRGRFTPSLDLLSWFVGGKQDDVPRGQQLTQLRPTLAWQLKRGSRWQLMGGPTLNLATAHRDGQRTRWSLGQGQWLWLDSEDGPDLLRLWPGIQLGVRF